MRLYILLTVIVGLMILFNYAGINTSTGQVFRFIDIIDNPQNIETSTFTKIILAIFTSALVLGIGISFFTKTSPISALIAPLAATLVLFVGDIIFIVNYANANYPSYIGKIVAAVLGALAVGYVLSVLDWWKGTD